MKKGCLTAKSVTVFIVAFIFALCAGAVMAFGVGAKTASADGDSNVPSVSGEVIVLDKIEDFRTVKDEGADTYSIVGSGANGAFALDADMFPRALETAISDSAIRKILDKPADYMCGLTKGTGDGVDAEETDEQFEKRVSAALFKEFMSGAAENKQIKIVIPYNVSYIGAHGFIISYFQTGGGTWVFGYNTDVDDIYKMSTNMTREEYRQSLIDSGATEEEVEAELAQMDFVVGAFLGGEIDESGESIKPNTYYRPPNIAAIEFAVDPAYDPAVAGSSRRALKELGNYLFGSCVLDSFVIPSNVKTNQAFMNLSYKSVEFESGCTEIPEAACRENIELASVVIPETVTKIGKNAFNGCKNLADITVLGENIAIADNAFSTNCESDFEVKVRIKSVAQIMSCKLSNSSANPLSPGGITRIFMPDDAGGWVEMKRLVIPDGTTTIPKNMFAGCMFEEVVFPGSLTEIQDYAFLGARGIRKLSIPSVTKIGRSAFMSARIEEVEIPANLKTLPQQAFAYSTVSRITFAPDCVLETIGKEAFANCNKLTEVSLPASLIKLDFQAFHYCPNLAEVKFAENSKLTTIGVGAFSSCQDLYSVSLPASVTTLGSESFYNCGNEFTSSSTPWIDHGFTLYLNSEITTMLSESVYTDGNLFGKLTTTGGASGRDGNAVVICANKAIYESFNTFYSATAAKEVGVASGKSTAITYEVKVTFSYKGEEIARPMNFYYNYDLPDEIVLPSVAGTWNKATGYGPYVTAGMLLAALSGNEAQKSLINSDGVVALVTSYRYGDVFTAQSGLVYDGNEYALNADLNQLLISDSMQITDAMTVAITEYKDANGVAADIPEVVCNAGVYTVKVSRADHDDETFEIAIARKRVDISDLTWMVVKVGEDDAEDALYASKIYLYIDGKGETYASLVMLDLSLPEYAGYTLSNIIEAGSVRNSIARYRGEDNALQVAVDAEQINNLQAEYSRDTTAALCGAYTVQVVLSATANYEPYLKTTLYENSGVTVTDNHDGSFVLVKRWYIVSSENWLVTSADATEESYVLYRVALESVFGQAPEFGIPYIMRGDVAADKYGTLEDPLVMTLFFGNTKIGDFDRSNYARYINAAMPVGRYTLEVRIADVAYGEGKIGGFSREYEFSVTLADLPAEQLGALNTVLKNKSFAFDYDNAMHLLTDEARTAINALGTAVAAAQPDRTGTVWENTGYNDYYGDFKATFNLDRMNSGMYFTENDLNGEKAKPVDPSRYIVYYMITAKNYAPLVEQSGVSGYDSARRQFVFYVTIVREIDIPAANSVVYNGSAQKADIASSEFYTVNAYDGFTNAAVHKVTITLVDAEYYRWKGKQLGEASATVDFEIIKAGNDWIEAPDVVRWIEGKYKENENGFIGAAKFGNITYIITDTADNVLYDAEKNINKLAGAKAGTYILKASVAATADYNGLSEAFTIKILEKAGMPWWGTLLIVLGALSVVAIVLWILHEKGVLQMLSGKIVIAIRTKMTVDATIAAVRANKRAEESKKSIAKAELMDRLEAAKKAREEERNKPPEERAQALEERAAAENARAEKAQQRAERLQNRAQKIKGDVKDEPDPPTEE